MGFDPTTHLDMGTDPLPAKLIPFSLTPSVFYRFSPFGRSLRTGFHVTICSWFLVFVWVSYHAVLFTSILCASCLCRLARECAVAALCLPEGALCPPVMAQLFSGAVTSRFNKELFKKEQVSPCIKDARS